MNPFEKRIVAASGTVSTRIPEFVSACVMIVRYSLDAFPGPDGQKRTDVTLDRAVLFPPQGPPVKTNFHNFFFLSVMVVF